MQLERIKPLKVVGFLVVAAAVMLTSGPAAAQNIERFCGTYLYVGGDKQRAARDAAIETAVSSLNRLWRPLARSGLRKAADVAERLVFRCGEPGAIGIIVGDRAPIHTKTDGTPQQISLSGLRITVSRTWEGNVLHAVASKGETRRRADYQFSPDGNTLTVTISVETAHMEQPLRYDLSYRREGYRPGAGGDD